MTSRQYRLGRRQTMADETRTRIVMAARALIAQSDGTIRPFSLDAVAQEAGVARTTVYHQFGTRAALLEALFDDVAARGEIGERVGAAFSQPDARDVLRGFIEAFAFFWQADRVVMRRVQAMAVLDPELERGVQARNLRRRSGAEIVIRRLRAEGVLHDTADSDETLVEMLYTLSGFATFHLLAGERPLSEVTPLVQRMAWRAIIGS